MSCLHSDVFTSMLPHHGVYNDTTSSMLLCLILYSETNTPILEHEARASLVLSYCSSPNVVYSRAKDVSITWSKALNHYGATSIEVSPYLFLSLGSYHYGSILHGSINEEATTMKVRSWSLMIVVYRDRTFLSFFMCCFVPCRSVLDCS